MSKIYVDASENESPGGGGVKVQQYSLSLTSAIDEGGWLTPRRGRFTPRKSSTVPIV